MLIFFSNPLFICHSYGVSVKRGLNWRLPGYIIWYRWILCLFAVKMRIIESRWNVIETRFFSNDFNGIYSEQVAKISSCTYIERDGQCDKVISSHDRWHENTPCLPYLKVAGLVTSIFILMTHVLTCAYPTPTPTTTNTTPSLGVFNQQARQMPLLFWYSMFVKRTQYLKCKL